MYNPAEDHQLIHLNTHQTSALEYYLDINSAHTPRRPMFSTAPDQ